MKNVLMSRLSSNSGEATTISILMWMVFAVVVVVGVGRVVYPFVIGKATNVGECIEGSNSAFLSTDGKCD